MSKGEKNGITIEFGIAIIVTDSYRNILFPAGLL